MSEYKGYKFKNVLYKEHIEELYASGLSNETINNSEIRSGKADELNYLLNRSDIDCSGLIFPYPNTDPQFFRIKPSGIVLDRNGKPAKYLQKADTTPRLYLPYGISEAFNDRSSNPLGVIITEGEKKALKASQELWHKQKKFLIIGLGGVWNWTTTITRWSDKKKEDEELKIIIRDLSGLDLSGRTIYICFDGDKFDKPEVMRAENELSYYITTHKKPFRISSINLPNEPGLNKLDDFFVTKERSNKDAVAEFEKLIEQSTNREFLKYRIKMIRSLPNTSGREKLDKITSIVLDDQCEMGRFFNNHSGTYIFIKDTKQIHQIEEEHYAMYLATLYGLYRSQQEFHAIYSKVEEEAYFKGKQMEIRNFAYYDKENNVSYIYTNNGLLLKIDQETIQSYDNGTDNVFFKHRNENQEIKYIPGCKGYLDTYLLNIANFHHSDLTMLDNKQQILLFKVWLYSLFFPNLLPTKPILVMTGDYGSGKSTIQRLVGKLLFGNSFNVTTLEDKRDFLTNVITKYYLVYDNVDIDEEWVRNAIASLSTGFKIEIRKLYSNLESFEADPIAYLALNSMGQSLYKRPDIASRLLIFRNKKLETKIPEAKLLSGILSNRNQILSEMIDQIKGILYYINNDLYDYSGNFRMADFANLGYKIAAVTDQEFEFKLILDILGHEQQSLPLEDNPLITLLEKWLDCPPGNYGNYVSSSELYGNLSLLSKITGITFPYKSVMSFAKNLSISLDSLRQVFDIEMIRRTGNKIEYNFSKKRNIL